MNLVRERYRVRLSESVALHALITSVIPANGRRVRIDDLIAQAIQTRGQHLLAVLTPILADHRRLLIDD